MPDLTVATTAQQVTDQALIALHQGSDVIIEAHAGAGKTGGQSSGTVRMAAGLANTGARVALLVAQNEQVGDTLTRLTTVWPDLTTYYVPPSSGIPADVAAAFPGGYPPNLVFANRGPGRSQLQSGPGLFVMTSAKFSFLAPPGGASPTDRLTVVQPFDVVIVDEAWMVPTPLWLRLRCLARHLALIGDPGQIMPWLPDADYYPGMVGSPVEPLPDLVRRERAGNVREFTLAVTRRNASHTTDLTGQLPAYAASPTRPMLHASEVPLNLGAIPLQRQPVDTALTAMATGGLALHRVAGGIAPQDDSLVAQACAQAVDRLLTLGAQLGSPAGTWTLSPGRVAILVAHHDQKAAVQRVLAGLGRVGPSAPQVATFNTIQGATVDVAIVWHPLSGRADVSAFHADAGRLTVGLTRHTHGCLLVSRDGVGDRLASAPVCSDLEGDARDGRFAGLLAHTRVWQALA